MDGIGFNPFHLICECPMSEEKTSLAESAATQLVGDIYKDLAHPTAQRVGRALETISKIALSPVSMLDWGYEQTKDWLNNKVTQRLESVPMDCITSPPLNIAIPVITRIGMTHDAPELRELYAELLLKAMDERTKNSVHPSYVYVVEQICPEEALVLVGLHELGRDDLFREETNQYTHGDVSSIEDQFRDHCRAVGVLHPDLSGLWLDNFLRLRLVSLSSYTDAAYVEEFFSRASPRVETTDIRYLRFTNFGRGFVHACAPAGTYEKQKV